MSVLYSGSSEGCYVAMKGRGGVVSWTREDSKQNRDRGLITYGAITFIFVVDWTACFKYPPRELSFVSEWHLDTWDRCSWQSTTHTLTLSFHIYIHATGGYIYLLFP